MSVADVKTPLDAENLRCKSLVDNDLDTVEALLDDGLFYVHASGVAEGKTALLSHFREGRVRYLKVTWQDQKLIDLGPDAGVVYGRVSVDVQIMGKDAHPNLFMTGVWSRKSGSWKMVSYQTTSVSS
jgi:hypothetical protein